MGNWKRIFKTGALAMAVTAGFGIFAYRAAEWSKGIRSEMIVLGQGSNTDPGSTPNSCGASSTGTSSVQTVRVIPQIALDSFDGGLTKYSTIIQIVNTSGAGQAITANFYKPDGTALQNVSLVAGNATITNGVLSATTIASDGVLVITGGGNGGPGALAWGKITACGALSISTFFELRDVLSNVLYSRVGVAASPGNMSSFVIPRVRDVATGLDVGFAIVNTGSASATLTAELKGPAGNTIAVKDITMAPGTHQATFTNQLFDPLNDPAGRSYQFLKFSSTSPTWAAIALAFEGSTQTSFPVDALQ